MQNLNYLFNKAYYRNLGTPAFEIDVKKFNGIIEKTKFNPNDYKPSPFEKKPKLNKFEFKKIIMKIGYPGLIIGMGNPHSVGTKEFDWKNDIKTLDNRNIRIVGDLQIIFQKFFSGIKFNSALEYAAKDVLSVNLSESQIEFVKNSLSHGELSDMSFFGSVKKAEKFVQKIVDMCISGNEEIKNGFSFDYTTGQPYIPASSVKGTLRSYFKEKRMAVSEIIKTKTEIEFSTKEMELLESDIFDNSDVFLDAVIHNGDKDGYILSTDYITPHESPTKNPVPIRILKINPGVQIEFRFILNYHTINEKTVSQKMLEEIFKELLSLFGVGAKTNVGYGILNDPIKGPLEEVCVNGVWKVRCPHCDKWTYKFDINNNLNTVCKNQDCRKPLIREEN